VSGCKRPKGINAKTPAQSTIHLSWRMEQRAQLTWGTSATSPKVWFAISADSGGTFREPILIDDSWPIRRPWSRIVTGQTCHENFCDLAGER
jgi:hypothetical protein